MKNQIFDWNRFTLALRKEVTENWRQIGLAMLVLYGVMTLMMVFGNWMSEGRDIDGWTSTRYMMVFFAFSMSSIVMASLAFRGLMTKTGRAELLTSPSSMTEKFIVNVLIYVVGYTLAFIVITQIADLTRIAVLWWAQSDTFKVPGPINFTVSINKVFSEMLASPPIKDQHGLFVIAAYLGIVANAGLYLLGSVLWPKLSFLKTFAAVYIIQTVLFIVGIIIVKGLSTPDAVGMMILENLKNGSFATMMLVATVVQLVLFWVLAWVVFRRKDIVSQGIFK